MLLTITQHYTNRGQSRYVITQDEMRTHMMNDASLDWHLKNKLSLTASQAEEVFNEIYSQGKATLELVPVQESIAS